MHKTIRLLVLMALALSACSAATTVPQAVPPTEMTANTATATNLPPASTPEPGQTPEAEIPSTGATVYRLVPGESELTYSVGETFIDQNNRFNVAEGTTPEIEGEIMVDLSSPQNSEIGTLTADISRFTSDSGRRDQAIRDRFLQSGSFPIVTFTATDIQGLPETYTPGQDITFTVEGDVTIRDVTLPIVFDVTARATPDELTGEAEATFLMSDFGFGPISIAGILGTEDEVKIRLSFLARP